MSASYRGGEPVAQVVRSGFAESFHRGSVAVTDPAGNLVASIGDTGSPVFPRSSNKPMQALAMLRAGWEPGSEADLAIAAASHRGEPFHLERVRSVLAGAGLGEEHLQCPPDLPGNPDARNAVVALDGPEPKRVYMNCSGKHSGMLAACAAAGWDLAAYRDPEHPLQELVTATVEELTGDAVEHVGVDGCGAPVLAVSLHGIARAFARFVEAPEGTPERRVADAMRAHPHLIDGTNGPDNRSMTAVPGLLAKGGAEGFHVVAVPGVGAAAVKIDDGAGRASMPVALRALATMAGWEVPLAAKPEIDALTWPEVLGGGEPVGRVRTLL
ncbi:asparaginase [Glycomyces terrestris]|uniref:Asparaginase n=1 Tax=Glycomyces terrestris TaxID=2493553 RepID=A0A426UYI4_9ACTN|nr:asparaginase [Glycomyces terrestris]RRR99631.1 asparaginase [Glycomyces terrestris]